MPTNFRAVTDDQLVQEIRHIDSDAELEYLLELLGEVTNRFEARCKPLVLNPGDEFLKPLANRERAVVDLVLAGASTADIGEKLKLTKSTVVTYMKRIFGKLGVHSRVELVAKATGRA